MRSGLLLPHSLLPLQSSPRSFRSSLALPLLLPISFVLLFATHRQPSTTNQLLATPTSNFHTFTSTTLQTPRWRAYTALKSSRRSASRTSTVCRRRLQWQECSSMSFNVMPSMRDSSMPPCSTSPMSRTKPLHSKNASRPSSVPSRLVWRITSAVSHLLQVSTPRPALTCGP